MGDCIEFTLRSQHPRAIYPVTSSALTFEVRAEIPLSIILATDLRHISKCRIGLGVENNQKSIIDVNGPIEFDTENVLSGDEFRKFWLTWFDGCIRLGRDREPRPFMEAEHHLPKILYISFGALQSSSTILLKIDLAPLRPPEKPMYFDDGKPVWKTRAEQLPLGAVIGGIDKEPQYVIRARHNGSLTPGKFVPSEEVSYIPWSGNAHEKEEFEVLCGYNFKWVKSSKDNIPIGAMQAGHTEQTHEPLYVGRAEHEGCLIPGKVQASHKVCYIPYKEKEIPKSHYEILVHVEDSHRMRYALTPHECLGGENIYGGENDVDDLLNRRQPVILIDYWS